MNSCKTENNIKLIEPTLSEIQQNPSNPQKVLKENRGAYLAGLIEGDGCISTPKKEDSSHNAEIIIVFHLKDRFFAEHLKKLLNCGRITHRKKSSTEYSNCIDYRIGTIEGVYKIAKRTNGYYRTPKIEAFWRLIDWLQHEKNKNISKLSLDQSPLLENAWFSGFLEADSCFSASVYTQTVVRNGIAKTYPKVFTRWELKQRQHYHRTNNYGFSTDYGHIMNQISQTFGTKTILGKNNAFQSPYYGVRLNTNKQKDLLVLYLEKYPLYSSKYNDFKDWCKIRMLRNNIKILDAKTVKTCQTIIQNMNSTRFIFDWSHLP
jgi:hypothetical protein